MLGVRRFPAKLINVERAKFTSHTRAGLRLAITKVARAAEGLVGRASHDVDDDRRHATFDRSWVGDWNFLRVHSAVSAENAVVDCRGVDFPLQQDCCRDSRNAARCRDLGDAGDLCCRIPVGVLDNKSPCGAARPLSPVWTARLRALACLFTGHLAHLLAGICWFAFDRRPFGDIRLLSHAVAYQPRADTAEKRLRVERVVLNALVAMHFAA